MAKQQSATDILHNVTEESPSSQEDETEPETPSADARESARTKAAQTVDADAHPLDAILEEREVKPLKEGEIIEGTLAARSTAAVFIDLGARGTGIIFGREFFLARDTLKQREMGDPVQATVVEPENEDGYVELSLAAAQNALAWDEIRSIFEEKKTITVTIDGANRGGLLANVHGIKSFLPASQLSPDNYPRVQGGNKDKILEELRKLVGETLEVKIISTDEDDDKVIISELAVFEEEIREELENYQIGDVIEGTISGIVDYGLFVRFGPDEKIEGLVHISEIANEHIDDIHGRFDEGEKVRAKIIDIQGPRVSLSIKALLETEPAGSTPESAPAAADTEEQTAEADTEDKPASPSQGEPESTADQPEEAPETKTAETASGEEGTEEKQEPQAETATA